jgi:hypothetical protein
MLLEVVKSSWIGTPLIETGSIKIMVGGTWGRIILHAEKVMKRGKR